MLPTRVVGVGDKAREPLRQKILVGIAILKIFVATASADRRFVDDVGFPVEANLDAGAGAQRLRQINAHHGVVHCGAQRPTRGIAYRTDFVPVFTVLKGLMTSHRRKAQTVALADAIAARARIGGHFGAARDGAVFENILIELQPDVGERIRRTIHIGDALGSDQSVTLLVQLDLDAIVRALLPVLCSWCARGGTSRSCGGQQGLELRETQVRVTWDALAVAGVGGRESGGEEEPKQGGTGVFHPSILPARRALWDTRTP